MIIQTTFHVPGEKESLVQRTDLQEKLSEGLRHQLTLLTGTVGNGKSTLLGQWARHISHPVGWVSLDRHHNDIFTFWREVLTSLYSFAMELNDKLTEHSTNMHITTPSFITQLANHLACYDDTIVLIWDDFHILTNKQVLESIDYFLQNLPKNVHIYIAGQTQPDLTLSNIYLKEQLYELNETELRFTKEEVIQFFQKSVHVHLESPLCYLIQQRTEGWISGIRMMALLLQSYQERGIPLIRESLESITGGNAYITRYFSEKVLSALPSEEQLYLLQTSVLERMNAPLMEAITGMEYGELFLQYVERENLFLVPMDLQNEWFRYHPLFREFLQVELFTRFPDMKKEVHRKAAEWFEEKGFSLEALDHYLAAELYDLALRLLKRNIPTLLHDGQYALVNRLHQVPNAFLYKNPTLFLAKTASLYLSGFVDEATYCYWWAMRRLKVEQKVLTNTEKRTFEAGLNFLVAFRSFIEKDFLSFLDYSRRYLAIIPLGDLFIHFGADKDGHHFIWDVFVSDEHPQEAEPILKEALELWSGTKNAPFYAHLCIDYASLLYEKGHLPEAKSYAEKALYIGAPYKIITLIFKSKFIMAKIAFALNQQERASIILEELEKRIQVNAHPFLIHKIHIYQQFQQLKSADYDQAFLNQLYEDLEVSEDIFSAKFEEYYLIARHLHLQHHKVEVERLLYRLIEIAENKQHYKAMVRCKLLLSFLFYKQKNYPKSYQMLEATLMISEREGYLRTILDEGACLGEVLEHYIDSVQQHHYTYIRKQCFLYAKMVWEQFVLEMGDKKRFIGAGQQSKREVILTAKEQIVLICINKGLSNREIALELDISLSTVKTHINHLYRKLHVNKRVLAIQRAKELKLI